MLANAALRLQIICAALCLAFRIPAAITSKLLFCAASPALKPRGAGMKPDEPLLLEAGH